jgi:hypothetical protein
MSVVVAIRARQTKTAYAFAGLTGREVSYSWSRAFMPPPPMRASERVLVFHRLGCYQRRSSLVEPVVGWLGKDSTRKCDTMSGGSGKRQG